jgi:superfamily I DNA and/or RNA helicase
MLILDIAFNAYIYLVCKAAATDSGRGQQVVVVGDSRQLPPTSFFDALVGSDDAESDDAEPDDESTTASDIESVLGLLCSHGRRGPENRKAAGS